MTTFLWICFYLLINTILALISSILIDSADTYWKKQEDAPNIFLVLVFMFPIAKVMKYGTMMYVYIRIFFLILISKKDKIPARDKAFAIRMKWIAAILLILLYLPIFSIGIFIESYLEICEYLAKRESRKNK